MINKFCILCVFVFSAQAKTGIYMPDTYSQGPILSEDRTIMGETIKNQVLDATKNYADMIGSHLLKKAPHILLSSVFVLSVLSAYNTIYLKK